MNVTLQFRLDHSESEHLKQIAKEHNESVSALLVGAIKDVLEGREKIEAPIQTPKKKSSLCLDHDLAVRFKDYVKGLGVPMDQAMEQLAHSLTNTASK